MLLIKEGKTLQKNNSASNASAAMQFNDLKYDIKKCLSIQKCLVSKMSIFTLLNFYFLIKEKLENK